MCVCVCMRVFVSVCVHAGMLCTCAFVISNKWFFGVERPLASVLFYELYKVTVLQQQGI